MTPEKTVAALQDLIGQISPKGPVSPPPITDRQSVTEWADWVQKTAHENRLIVSGAELEKYELEAWQYWVQRLRYQLSMPKDPRLGSIVTHVLSRGPGLFLYFDIESMSIESWTKVITTVLTQPKVPVPDDAPPPLMTGMVPPFMAMAALQHLYFDDPTLARFASYLWYLDKSLSPEEFPQLGSAADSRRPAGLLVCRENCRSMYWKPDQKFPLLICDFASASVLASILSTTQKKLYEFLGITFVAFDFNPNMMVPVTEEASPGLEVSSSALSSKALFESNELQVYNSFSPYPKAPIPVMIDDPRRYPALDPNFTATNINSPQELFDVVSRMLPRHSD